MENGLAVGEIGCVRLQHQRRYGLRYRQIPERGETERRHDHEKENQPADKTKKCAQHRNRPCDVAPILPADATITKRRAAKPRDLPPQFVLQKVCQLFLIR
jgi:hypothetical protein